MDSSKKPVKNSPIISKMKPQRVFMKRPPNFNYSALRKLGLFEVFVTFLAYRRLSDEAMEEEINREISQDLALPNSKISSPQMRRFFTIERERLIELTEATLAYESIHTVRGYSDSTSVTKKEASDKKDTQIDEDLLDLKEAFEYLCGIYFRTGKFELEQSIRLVQK